MVMLSEAAAYVSSQTPRCAVLRAETPPSDSGLGHSVLHTVTPPHIVSLKVQSRFFLNFRRLRSASLRSGRAGLGRDGASLSENPLKRDDEVISAGDLDPASPGRRAKNAAISSSSRLRFEVEVLGPDR